MGIDLKDLQILKIFNETPSDHLNIIAASIIKREYNPGQMIFLEGDESIGLWFVLDGHVKIIKYSQSGRLQGLCFVNSGKCFGGCPLFDTDTNPANAQALDNVTLAVLLRDDLRRLLRTHPTIVNELLKVYNKRLGLLARLGESLGTWTVPMRINDCLVAYATSDDDRLVVHLTHDEIATLAGTVREVVTRHLNDLESVNIVKTTPGRIILLQIENLSSQCIINNPAPRIS